MMILVGIDFNYLKSVFICLLVYLHPDATGTIHKIIVNLKEVIQ